MSGDGNAVNLSVERDQDIGRDTYLRLQHLNRKLCRSHNLTADRVADFLAAGVLFHLAQVHDCSLDDAVALVAELGRSVQEDELFRETRH